jgi:hypothetical protein
MLSKTVLFLSFFTFFLFVKSNCSFAENTTPTNQSQTSITSSESHHHQNKDFEWELVLASEQIKDSETASVSGLYTSFKNSFLYSLNPEDQFRLYGSYVIEHYNNYHDKNYFELAEVMYRRKSLLNENDHFVNVDLELKHGVVIDPETRNYWGFNSETIPQLIIKKRIGNGYGIETKLRHHIYNRNTRKARALTNEDRIYLSAYKMFGHQFLINTELKYRHKIYTGKFYSYERGGMMNKNYEDLVIHPSLMYFYDRKTLIEGYVESKLNTSFDDKTWNQSAKDELILGAAIYFTII